MTIEEHPQSKEEQNGVHHLGGAKFLNDPPCIICMHGLVCVRTECRYIIKTCLSTIENNTRHCYLQIYAVEVA